MKALNEVAWQNQVKEALHPDGNIKETDETGKQFLDFLVFWAEAAEKMIEEEEMAPANALRAAFTLTQDAKGRLVEGFMSDMLTVLASHWAYANDAFRDFTSIELHEFTNALHRRAAALQMQAEETPS